MKHTPGPWKVIILDNQTYINPNRRSDEYALIARIHGNANPDLQKANAHLIAAAPDLLEACIRLQYWLIGIDGPKHLRRFVDEAIAKAGGRDK